MIKVIGCLYCTYYQRYVQHGKTFQICYLFNKTMEDEDAEQLFNECSLPEKTGGEGGAI